MATDASSPSLSSLPPELLLSIFVRVPKRCHPIVSCVSKKFRDLVRSREFQLLRRKQGKDSLYIHITGPTSSPFEWFTLRRNETNPTENLFTRTNFPGYPYYRVKLKPIAIGPEIFLIDQSPSCFQIYDSRSEVLTKLPPIQVRNRSDYTFSCVGSVGKTVYVFVRRSLPNDIDDSVELFDTNLRLGWQIAPDIKDSRLMLHPYFHTKEIDKKICVLRSHGVTSYNPEDGACDSNINMPQGWRRGACVIDNILFAYVSRLGGLMWYDSTLNQWKVVDGLNLSLNDQTLEMGEYYGELALLWLELDAICCTFIALERSGSGFSGTAEPNKQLAALDMLPSGATLTQCLSVLV